MTLRESLRGVLRQAVVHPSMVDDPGLFNGTSRDLSATALLARFLHPCSPW